MRQCLPGGRRGPWQGATETQPPFQRTDGSFMTDEEIAKVAKQIEDPRAWNHKTPGSARSGPQSGRRLSDEQLEETATIAREQGHAKAAEILGISPATVKDRVELYRKREREAGVTIAQVPAERPTRDSQAAAAESPFKAAFEAGLREGTPAVVEAMDEVKRKIAAGETGSGQWAPRPRATPESAALTPLLDWLEINAPTWTQDEAERWFKAFTATVDLVYPTKAAA